MAQSIKATIRFCFIALILFGIGYILLQSILPWRFFEKTVAFGSVAISKAVGATWHVVIGKEIIYLSNNVNTVAIIPLCTGYLEWIIVAAFIAASEDRSWKYRIYGIIGAAIFVYIANIIRISYTINVMGLLSYTQIDLMHNIGFKVLLFIVVAGYYAIWYVGIPRLLSSYKNWSVR